MRHASSVLSVLAVMGALVSGGGTSALAAEIEVRSYNEQAKLHPLGQHHDSEKPLETVKGSKANLTVTRNGAYICLETRQLTPGHVYTMWFGIYNKPEQCKAKPCDVKDFLVRHELTEPDMGYADGLIAKADGTAKFSAFIPAGSLSHDWYGNGFQNLKHGEVHLVVHDHGKLIPERAAEMLGTYRGGCKTESLFKDFPEISKSDGKPGPNDCNLTQLVRFVQD